MKHICVCYGDGIGPEIMNATLDILRAAKFNFVEEKVILGEEAYKAGYQNGIEDSAWDKIKEHKILLKAPLTTPQGKGFKSANVTLRKTLGMYANVRPCVSYNDVCDAVIIRENEEDLYAGIEHRQTNDVYQCLKLITVPGCEKIARFAFEYAVKNNRQKITCVTKDNIMKMTDGLFHNVFNEMAKQYPQIQTEHLIVDIGAAKIATQPEKFDVILAPNLYGDIISDIMAEVAGSVGLSPSANYGDYCSMFEAVHGSAPDIAGKNIANPSGLLLSAVMMLVHIGELEIASKIHNAWLYTIEQGYHTADFSIMDTTIRPSLSTQQFTEAIIQALGSKPSFYKPVTYQEVELPKAKSYVREKSEKKLLGVDIFLCEDKLSSEEIAEKIQSIADSTSTLQVITNRGVKVWPNPNSYTFCTDHWRCRFIFIEDNTPKSVIRFLMHQLEHIGLDVIKTENLYSFDGVNGYTQAQGQ